MLYIQKFPDYRSDQGGASERGATSNIPFVLQKAVLFGSTIPGNIGYSRIDVSPAKIEAIARSTRLFDSGHNC